MYRLQHVSVSIRYHSGRTRMRLSMHTHTRFHIAFADGNKYARMSDDELNDLFGHFKNVINKDPSKAIAVLIVPTLSSLKRKRGDRDERSRIERKADAKQMDAQLSQLYMNTSETHGNDVKQRSYDTYILFSDDEEALGDNPFIAQSFMMQRRGTMQDAQWVDPTAVYVPITAPGGVTVMSDLNIEKRVAQLLGGHDVPRCLMDALCTSKTGKPLLKPADVCIWSHWTPLDGCFELVMRQESMKPMMPSMPSFSATTAAQDALACKARLVSIFLKDWKSKLEVYIVGEPLKYSEELTEAKKKEIGDESPVPPTLHLCTWVTEDGKECLSLPDEIRNKWMEHAVFAEQWRAAIKAFTKATKTLLSSTGGVNEAPPATEVGAATDEGDWAIASEENIRAQHDIEKEIATEFTNIVYLVSRSKKLFAVSRGGQGTIASDKHVFHHGVGDWTKPPNAEKLLTKETEDKCQTFCISSDGQQCVLEIVPEGGRTSEDTDSTTWGDFLRDLEGHGMGDAKVFGHTYSRPEGAMTSNEADHFMMECTLQNSTHWVWKPRNVDIAKATLSNVANIFPIAQLEESPKVRSLVHVSLHCLVVVVIVEFRNGKGLCRFCFQASLCISVVNACRGFAPVEDHIGRGFLVNLPEEAFVVRGVQHGHC